MKKIVQSGEFSLVHIPHETHVWLSRHYLENGHPVLDTLQIPDDRIQAVIALLEVRQGELDDEARLLQARYASGEVF